MSLKRPRSGAGRLPSRLSLIKIIKTVNGGKNYEKESICIIINRRYGRSWHYQVALHQEIRLKPQSLQRRKLSQKEQQKQNRQKPGKKIQETLLMGNILSASDSLPYTVLFDNCREGFIQGLAEEGFVEGENLTILYENANADGGTSSQIITNFISKRLI